MIPQRTMRSSTARVNEHLDPWFAASRQSATPGLYYVARKILLISRLTKGYEVELAWIWIISIYKTVELSKRIAINYSACLCSLDVQRNCIQATLDNTNKSLQDLCRRWLWWARFPGPGSAVSAGREIAERTLADETRTTCSAGKWCEADRHTPA